MLRGALDLKIPWFMCRVVSVVAGTSQGAAAAAGSSGGAGPDRGESNSRRQQLRQRQQQDHSDDERAARASADQVMLAAVAWGFGLQKCSIEYCWKYQT